MLVVMLVVLIKATRTWFTRMVLMWGFLSPGDHYDDDGGNGLLSTASGQ